MKQERIFMAVDPGKHKCGVAVMDGAGGVLEKAILRREVFVEGVREILSRHPGAGTFAVGGGTTSGEVLALLRENFPGAATAVVEEKNTTRLARERFFAENPRKRRLRIFPLSLFLTQPEVDAYAAVVIGERFIESGGL